MTVEGDRRARISGSAISQRGALSRLTADGHSVEPDVAAGRTRDRVRVQQGGTVQSVRRGRPTRAACRNRCRKARGISSRRRGRPTGGRSRSPSSTRSPAPTSGCSISRRASGGRSCARSSTNRTRASRPTGTGSPTCRTSRDAGMCSCGPSIGRGPRVQVSTDGRRVAVLVGRRPHAVLQRRWTDGRAPRCRPSRRSACRRRC